MRFASLGSGSRGNGTLIEYDTTCILVDCGFALRETEQRLTRLAKQGCELSAILITHEHSDHIRGVAPLARKYGVPVWMTAGTWAPERFGDLPELHLFNSHEAFVIGALQVCPFPVPHDARDPSQFVFDNGNRRLGLLTDTGCATPHIEHMLTACDALLLECNHDSAMLEGGHYSWPLKKRVGGGMGHLSNAQAAQLLQRLNLNHLQHVIAMHLSENNNTPELARAALGEALGCNSDWIGIADQTRGLTWRALL